MSEQQEDSIPEIPYIRFVAARQREKDVEISLLKKSTSLSD